MKPAKSAQGEEQGELYQRRLSTLLDQRHPLYVLAVAIDWEFFEQEFGSLYVEQKGRSELPMRLLVSGGNELGQAGWSNFWRKRSRRSNGSRR